MMKWMALSMLAAVPIAGCGEGIAVVESGSYEGAVAKVVPAEKEIYVNLDNGKKIELYFSEDTKLTQDGEAAEFSALSQGTRVRVEVKRVGKRLEPVTVEILK